MLIDDPGRFDGVAVVGVDEHAWRQTTRLDELQAKADEAVARISEDQAQADGFNAYVQETERQAEPEVFPPRRLRTWKRKGNQVRSTSGQALILSVMPMPVSKAPATPTAMVAGLTTPS